MNNPKKKKNIFYFLLQNKQTFLKQKKMAEEENTNNKKMKMESKYEPIGFAKVTLDFKSSKNNNISDSSMDILNISFMMSPPPTSFSQLEDKFKEAIKKATRHPEFDLPEEDFERSFYYVDSQSQNLLLMSDSEIDMIYNLVYENRQKPFHGDIHFVIQIVKKDI